MRNSGQEQEWKPSQMVALIREKDIDVFATHEWESIEGAVFETDSGRRTISYQHGMSNADKTSTLAIALGHIALNHTNFRTTILLELHPWPQDETIKRDSREERNDREDNLINRRARMWAAQFLMKPDVVRNMMLKYTSLEEAIPAIAKILSIDVSLVTDYFSPMTDLSEDMYPNKWMQAS